MNRDQEQLNTNGHDDDLDADAILAELEAEEEKDISSLKVQRVTEAQQYHRSIQNTTRSARQDVYTTLKSDDETLQYTTEHEKAVVHFFHPDFARCSIMDEHIKQIAEKHAEFGPDATEDEVKFARVDVSHAEFVVQKLGIRVLPCVIGFVKGQIKGRIVGFEGVCWDGKEKGAVVTMAIEERLLEWNVLRVAVVKQQKDDESESEDDKDDRNGRRGITGRKQAVVDEDDDWD